MTRSNDLFNKRLLKILYALTRKREHMNSYVISGNVFTDDRIMSKRTVERWFEYLNDSEYETGFSYYPYFKYEVFGLKFMIVLIENLKDHKILDIIPYIHHVSKGSYNLKKYAIVMYAIPPKNSNQFEEFWNKAKKMKLIDNYEIIDSRSPIAFFSQFSKIFNKDGSLTFPENYDMDNRHFTELLRRGLNTAPKIKIHPAIIKNPLIVPILIEYMKNNYSSKQVWLTLKDKIPETVQKYVKSQQDGVGMKYIQDTMKFLNENFDDFFQQMRISYYPFYRRHTTLYFLLKLKNNSLVKFTEILSQHAISVIVYPSFDPKDNIAVFYVLTDDKEANNIMYNIIPDYIDHSYNNKSIIQHYHESAKHWKKEYTKLDYTAFDFLKNKWVYDHRKYMSALKN